MYLPSQFALVSVAGRKLFSKSSLKQLCKRWPILQSRRGSSARRRHRPPRSRYKVTSWPPGTRGRAVRCARRAAERHPSLHTFAIYPVVPGEISTNRAHLKPEPFRSCFALLSPPVHRVHRVSRFDHRSFEPFSKVPGICLISAWIENWLERVHSDRRSRLTTCWFRRREYIEEV